MDNTVDHWLMHMCAFELCVLAWFNSCITMLENVRRCQHCYQEISIEYFRGQFNHIFQESLLSSILERRIKCAYCFKKVHLGDLQVELCKD